jgi:hypothetical protein
MDGNRNTRGFPEKFDDLRQGSAKCGALNAQYDGFRTELQRLFGLHSVPESLQNELLAAVDRVFCDESELKSR